MALTKTPSELTAADLTITTAAQPNITSLGTLTTLTIDDITINGSTISDGGDLTLDVAGNIILDADGGEIKFQDGGTDFARIFQSGGDFYLNVPTQDTDLIIQGNDGGSNVSALTFDMSEGGNAVFGKNVSINAAGASSPAPLQAFQVILHSGGGRRGTIYYNSNSRISFAALNASNTWESMEIEAADINLNTGGSSQTTGLTVNSSQNVGIRNSSPSHMLVAQGAAGTSPIIEMINPDNEDGNTGRESSLRFSGFRSGGEAVNNAQISSFHEGTADDDKGMMWFYTNNGSGLNKALEIQSSGITRFFTGDGNSGIAEFHTNASSGNTTSYISIRPQGTARGYIGNGSSLLSGASDSDMIVRSEGDLIFNTSGNNRRVTINSSGRMDVGMTGGSGMLNVAGMMQMYTLTGAAQASGSVTLSLTQGAHAGGSSKQGSMMLFIGGYGNSLTGHVRAIYQIAGLLFYDHSSTSTITQISQTTDQCSLSVTRNGSGYNITLTNSNAVQTKSLAVTAILCAY